MSEIKEKIRAELKRLYGDKLDNMEILTIANLCISKTADEIERKDAALRVAEAHIARTYSNIEEGRTELFDGDDFHETWGAIKSALSESEAS